MFQSFCADVFSNTQVTVDPTNNAQPTKLIRELTGYTKTKNSKYLPIQNYQISHIFGRTKNIFTFTAPWNIVYMPKILDPFTGHEAKGDMVEEFSTLFQKQSYKHFESQISDYNALITSSELTDKIQNYLEITSVNTAIAGKDFTKLKDSILSELTPITL